MMPLLEKVAGVDVHKDQITITTLVRSSLDSGGKTETWESKTFTSDLERCGQKLLRDGIREVAMESTGIYWRPIFNVWSKMGLNITLGNATHIKNVPGRKTDVKDSEWIAELHSCGLIRKSYIPNEEFQQLRTLTRHRKSITGDIATVKNRIQKILEDGNVKLSSVLSDIFGVSGMSVLKAISAGETDPDRLVMQVTTKVQCTKEVLKKSLTHRLNQKQIFVLQSLMTQMFYLQQLHDETDKVIKECLMPHQELLELLDTIPGVDEKLAEDILAEATTNMAVFKDERHFAAWAGVAPGNNESAGKKKVQMSQRQPHIEEMPGPSGKRGN